MERKENLYEPVLDFRKQRQQIQIESIRHHELYEKAFLTGDNFSVSEYAMNTTTWD